MKWYVVVGMAAGVAAFALLMRHRSQFHDALEREMERVREQTRRSAERTEEIIRESRRRHQEFMDTCADLGIPHLRVVRSDD